MSNLSDIQQKWLLMQAVAMLKEMAHGKAFPEFANWIYCGNIFVQVNGWEFTFFVDCEELDYVDSVVSPEKTSAVFEDFDPADPIDLLDDSEVEELERMFQFCQQMHEEQRELSLWFARGLRGAIDGSDLITVAEKDLLVHHQYPVYRGEQLRMHFHVYDSIRSDYRYCSYSLYQINGTRVSGMSGLLDTVRWHLGFFGLTYLLEEY